MGDLTHGATAESQWAAGERDAARRVLQFVDACDPCPLCESWPEHEPTCVMAAPELDGLIGRGWGAANPPALQSKGRTA